MATDQSSVQSATGVHPKHLSQDPKVVLYGILGALGVILFTVLLKSPKVFFGILFGIAVGFGGIMLYIYYLLNIAERICKQDKDEEVKKKGMQPVMEGKTTPGAEYGGFLQVLPPNSRTPSTSWQWGDLRSNTIFYQDMKGAGRGALLLTDCRMTVIKTRTGTLWKSTNYIRLVNADRPLLGEYRECVLFFRNGKEMEEWYWGMKVACQANQSAVATSFRSRKSHFSNVMKRAGYDWENESVPSYRPPSASPAQIPSVTSVTNLSSNSTSSTTAYSNSNSSNGNNSHYSASGLPKSYEESLSNAKNHTTKLLNLFAHRAFYFLSDDPGFVGLVKKKIAAKLAKLKKPSMLASLNLREIHFGPNLPICSNLAIKSADPDGTLRVDADISYIGDANAEIDIVVNVEFFGTKFTEIPISFKVTIKSISGKCQLAFSPPPSDVMWFGFYTEPEIEMDINSSIGEKQVLVNIPQITNIIVYKLKQEIVEMMLLPDMDDWPLPRLKVPTGQSRIHHVGWEYQVGYVPPPRKRTEFDSSSSDSEGEPANKSTSSVRLDSTAKKTQSEKEIPPVSLKNPPTSALTQSPASKQSKDTSNSSASRSTSSTPNSASQSPAPTLPARTALIAPPSNTPPPLPSKPSRLGTESSSICVAPPVQAAITTTIPSTHTTTPSTPATQTPVAPVTPSNISVTPQLPSAAATIDSSIIAPTPIQAQATTQAATPTQLTKHTPIAIPIPVSPASDPLAPEGPPKVEVIQTSSPLIHNHTEAADAIFGPSKMKRYEEIAVQNPVTLLNPAPSAGIISKTEQHTTSIQAAEDIVPNSTEEPAPASQEASSPNRQHKSQAEQPISPRQSQSSTEIVESFEMMDVKHSDNPYETEESGQAGTTDSVLVESSSESLSESLPSNSSTNSKTNTNSKDATRVKEETSPASQQLSYQPANAMPTILQSDSGSGDVQSIDDPLIHPLTAQEEPPTEESDFVVVAPPPLPPRNPSIPSSRSSGNLSGSGEDDDPFKDIFSSGFSSSAFGSALKPPPPLPPRAKKREESSSPPNSFPKALYAEESPKSWSSGDDRYKSSSSLSSFPSATSVKAKFKSLLDNVTSKLED